MITDEQIKISGSISVAYRILYAACKKIPIETNLYQKKVKQLTNNLLDTIVPIIKLTRSEKLIVAIEKEDGISIDREDLSEDDRIRLKCVDDFISIVMNSNQMQTYNLSVALENIKLGRSLYTENELNYHLNKANLEFNKQYE